MNDSSLLNLIHHNNKLKEAESAIDELYDAYDALKKENTKLQGEIKTFKETIFHTVKENVKLKLELGDALKEIVKLKLELEDAKAMLRTLNRMVREAEDGN